MRRQRFWSCSTMTKISVRLAGALDFRDIASAVRANLCLIALIVAVALSIALVTTMLQTKRYTATLSIQNSNSGGLVLGSKED